MQGQKFSSAARIGTVVALVTGCAPRFQSQVVGRSTMVAANRADASPAAAAEVAVAASGDAQLLRYAVSLPRAVKLRYTVACPTAQREGTIGETFEQYRARRLKELERERREQASLIGAVVGSVAPSVHARADVSGPGGSATGRADVDPGAVAAAAAAEALPEAALPPGDTGAQLASGTVELGASPAGRCVVTLWPDPAAQDVSGANVTLELVHIIDLEAQKQAAEAKRQAAERERLAAESARQLRSGRELRLRLLVSLQRAGADPMARARARAAAEEEQRRKAAAAAEEQRRKAAIAAEEQRRRDAVADADQQRRAAAAEADRLRRLEAERRVQAEREARERAAAAERERRERPAREERERRERAAAEERRRQQEVELRLRLEHERRDRVAVEERERRDRVAAEERERRAAEARRLAWEARQRGFGLRVLILARLERQGADPLRRQHEAEEWARARWEEQRRLYEERQRREREAVAARRAAVDLRLQLLARLQTAGADPEYRRHRDENMFREMDAEARRLEQAQRDAEVRVRLETQAAVDLRVATKLRLRQVGAVDRPPCPAPPVEAPPPAPFAGATWIAGRYEWNGIAWAWLSGYYQRPPQPDTVWVPPVHVSVGGTLVVRPGRWVHITITSQ